MPRPRTPTNVLDARDAFYGKPGRRKAREDEPVVTEPIADPPKYLKAAVRKCWLEIVDTAPPGVLMKPDRIAVERAAVLLMQSRSDPWGFIAAKEARINSYLGQFGMNPSDRSRVKVAVKAPENDPPLGRVLTRYFVAVTAIPRFLPAVLAGCSARC